jgi:hypothetical protein
MAYNPYVDIKKVYDAKVAWQNATTDEERKRLNELATAARKTLNDYGYGYIANQVSANGADASAVKKILDNWATVTDEVTGTYKTGINNPAYNVAINAASTKNDERTKLINSDHANVNSKYNDLYAYANQDVTQTDEYKSAFDNIMPSYNLKAMQGRNNEAASGAASNGGNVDSFAAANAARQQAALTAKGQALAHQMGLDAYNSRISRVGDILSGLGVYNNGVYSALNEGVANDVGIANNIFNNEQTAKINDTSIKSEIASVTGLAPDEWVASNNMYINDDGTIKDQYKDVDFSVAMANAKAAGNTAAYNEAAVARYYKIMSDYKQYGQYDDGNYIAPGKRITEEARQFNEKIAQGDRTLIANTTDADKDRQVELEKAKLANQQKQQTGGMTGTQATTALKNGILTEAVVNAFNAAYGGSYTVENPPPAYKPPVQTEGDGNPSWTGDGNQGGANTSWDDFTGYFTDKKVVSFLNEQLKPYFDSGTTINEDVIKNLVVGDDAMSSNSTKYDLDVEDVKDICEKIGAITGVKLDTSWLDEYKNRGWWFFNKGKGMKPTTN